MPTRNHAWEVHVSGGVPDLFGVIVWAQPSKASEPDHFVLHYPSKEPTTPMEFMGMVPPGNESYGQKGKGFHNHLLVHELRRVLKAEPNIEYVEGNCTGVITTGDDSHHVTGVTWTDKSKVKHETHAALTVLGDGYYSVLRKVRLTVSHTDSACFARHR